jgi:hypothetical protein
MSLDNSPVTSDQYKTPIVNTPLLEGPGSAPGDSTMLSSACVPMLHDAPSPAFVPRNFPPPALAGVPVDYIVHKLHQMAPKYWDETDTADCTISKILIFFLKKNKSPPCSCLMLLVVPIPHPVGLSRQAPDMPLFRPDLPNKHDPAGLGRRAMEPILSAVPRVSFKVRRHSLDIHCLLTL